ncbi:YcaO-like family protein [Streptomyces erythrochromogenes]|uniref:YcaO-like family protein n=1 Tax=Streptomyces erythrochromogenes TaxID=285574 RepID=UPI00342634AA
MAAPGRAAKPVDLETAAGPAPGSPLGLVDRVTRDRPRVDPVPTCVSYSARLSPRPEFDRWSVDTVTGGAALGDHEQARQAAVGEAVERLCGNVVPDVLPVVPYTELVRVGRPAVDPREFALYSRTQYAHRGFPFDPISPELPIAWVAGLDLDDDSEVLVPASLAYVNYFRAAHAAEPPTNYPMLAGTAAGTSLEQAQRSALEEVLERDAVTLWWTSGAPATRLVLDAEGTLACALAEADAAGLTVTLLRVPSTVDALVAGAFIEDKHRGLVAFGSACRPTAEAAAAKAFTEAIGMHESGLELLEHDSGFWRAVRAGGADHRPYRPFRHDRAYLKDFRSDWRDVNDVRLHLQVHLDPAAQDSRLDRLRAPRSARPGNTAADGLGPAALRRRLSEQGMRTIVVDLTTPQVRAVGLHVVRVIVPGLYCNAPAAFPFLGGRRLYEEPFARGWLPRPLTESDLVRHPLPFS